MLVVMVEVLVVPVVSISMMSVVANFVSIMVAIMMVRITMAKIVVITVSWVFVGRLRNVKLLIEMARKEIRRVLLIEMDIARERWARLRWG
jgi:hypothetical protein